MKKMLILVLGVLFLGGCLDLSFAESRVVLRKELVKERVVKPVPPPMSILEPMASMTTQCAKAISGINLFPCMPVIMFFVFCLSMMLTVLSTGRFYGKIA